MANVSSRGRLQFPSSLLSPCVSVRFHDSLEFTNLTNEGKDMSGIILLAEALKTNEGLTSLKYARPPPTFPIWQVSAAFDAFDHMLASRLLAA